MNEEEFMQKSADALKRLNEMDAMMDIIRAKLAQPEPEPVAWMHDSHVGFNVPLYTAPPQREWVGLTATEIKLLRRAANNDREFAELVQAKLKDKNT